MKSLCTDKLFELTERDLIALLDVDGGRRNNGGKLGFDLALVIVPLLPCLLPNVDRELAF